MGALSLTRNVFRVADFVDLLVAKQITRVFEVLVHWHLACVLGKLTRASGCPSAMSNKEVRQLCTRSLHETCDSMQP